MAAVGATPPEVPIRRVRSAHLLTFGACVRCARSVRAFGACSGDAERQFWRAQSRRSAQRLGTTGPPTHQWRPENNGAVDSSRFCSEPFLESLEVDVVL
jgi:hypothetical protein